MLARRPLSGNELLAVCGALLAHGTDLDAKGVGTHNCPVQRIILVADRGLLSVDHLAMLDGLKVGDQPLEYIVAVPGRRYAEFVDVLAEVQPLCVGVGVGADAELIGEVLWTPAKAKDSPQKRLVWAHDPQRAAEQSTQRALDGRQIALGDQRGRLDAPRGGAALQELGRHRARLPCAQERPEAGQSRPPPPAGVKQSGNATFA